MRTAKPLSTPLLALALLLGCGGHSSPSVLAAERAGHVSLTIHWPARARYVPSAANLVEVQILDASGAAVDTVDFLRSQADPYLTQTISNSKLLSGGATYALSAQAYAETRVPPTGNALSVGTSSVTVVAGATTNQSVTMASTLAGFSVALTSLVTGASLGTYPISPGSTPPTPLPSVSARDVLGLSVTPLNAAAGTLTLYPTSSATPGLSATGSLVVGGQAASGTTLTGALAPTGVTTSTGALAVAFSDAGTPTLSASLPVNVTSVGPLVGDHLYVGDSYSGTGIACSSDGAYGVQVGGFSDGTTMSLVRLAGGTATVVQDLGTTLPEHLAALPGGQVFYSFGSVLYKANGGRVDTGAAVSALEAYGGWVYALSVSGTTVTARRYTAALAPVGLPTSFTTASSPTSLSVGPAPDGSEAFYAVEGGAVRRYVNGVGTLFAAAGPEEYLIAAAADGNLVWAYFSDSSSDSCSGTIRGYLGSTGVDVLDLALSAQVFGLSAGSGKLALQDYAPSGGGRNDVESFNY